MPVLGNFLTIFCNEFIFLNIKSLFGQFFNHFLVFSQKCFQKIGLYIILSFAAIFYFNSMPVSFIFHERHYYRKKKLEN